jgi:Adenylylsulfate kinase and related kinases
LLDDILDWIRTENTRQVFWLNGLAGTGKTTIAQTVAEVSSKNGELGASFFCSRDSSESSDYGRIFPTIAFQLAEGDVSLGSKISDAVKDDLDISSMRPDEQLKSLILGPLKAQGSNRSPLVIVIDALDECSDSSAAEKILLALAHNGAFSLPFLKVFVTSRPISSTRAAFKDGLLTSLSRVFALHEMDSYGVDQDIRHFITVRLQQVARHPDRFGIPPDWPPSSLVDRLVQKSSAFFIFASTACQYICGSGGDLEERLEDIANLPTSDYERSLGIDALYKRVFDTAFERFSDSTTIAVAARS